MINRLRSEGYDLPAIETDVSTLAKEEIFERVQDFWRRYDKITSSDDEFAPVYFVELLAKYPVSLCKRQMTDTLKLLIALFYFDSKPNPEEKEPIWNGYSYDNLALIFVRSKASIHDAIKEKEAKAKAILNHVQLRKKAREIALQQLVDEEKERLRTERYNQDEEHKRGTRKKMESLEV